MNRPTQNGSSNTTIEILTLLSVFGASALTLLALGSRGERQPVTQPRDEPESERKDG